MDEHILLFVTKYTFSNINSLHNNDENFLNLLIYYLLGCAQETPPPLPLSENAKGFLATLEHSSEEELALHLQDRMQFSKEAVAYLVCAFDRLHSHIDNMGKHAQTTGICGNMAGTLILMFFLAPET